MSDKGEKTIYFIQAFQGFHTYFADLALRLKNENDCKIGCITFGTDAFKAAQKISNEYINNDSYEEKYNFFRKNLQSKTYISQRIHELEKKYGSLWIIAHADRQYITYHHNEIYGDYNLSSDEIISIIIHWFDFFEKIFSEGEYTHVVSYATGGAPALIASKVIEKLNGHYIGLTNVGIPDRFSLTIGSNHDRLAINNYPLEEDKEWSKEFFEKYKTGNNIPSWINKDIQKLSKKTFFNRLINFSKHPREEKKIFNFIDFSDPGYLTKGPYQRLKTIIKNLFLRIHSYFYYRSLYDKNFIKNKYIFYPIPVEPESGRLIRAPYHINQIAFIENLSKSIPADHTLLIKDHPNMDYKRDLNFYKSIRAIPNILLIKSDVKISYILKRVSAVVVINGTTGIESLLNKKPVMIFSDTLYDSLQGVMRFNGKINDLSSQIRSLIKKTPPEDNELINYIAMLKKSSVDLTAEIFFRNLPSDEVVEKLYDLILMLDQEYSIIK